MKGKGFTLVELMVVVLIVAVLAAILVPYLTARLEAARWSEGKAGCGTLATALRAMWAEQGEENWLAATDPEAYLTIGDLRGKYFSIGDYTITFGTPTTEYPITYTIAVSQPSNPTTVVTWTKGGYSLNHEGRWTELTAP
jgi:prepilin-type N-terminal cleavage/methylation domain-containing protein